MTMLVVLLVSAVGSFAMGVWQGWMLRRPPPREPLLRVPCREHATLVISEGCVVELGAVHIDAMGTFDVQVAPNKKRAAASVIVGDA
jgi:hypothetical protein